MSNEHVSFRAFLMVKHVVGVHKWRWLATAQRLILLFPHVKRPQWQLMISTGVCFPFLVCGHDAFDVVPERSSWNLAYVIAKKG